MFKRVITQLFFFLDMTQKVQVIKKNIKLYSKLETSVYQLTL